MNPTALKTAAKVGYPRKRMLGVDIRKYVYGRGEGEMEDNSRIGTIYYNRGVVFGIITAEAVRVAQQHFGKGKPVTGAQVQWALEHLDIDAKRLRQLGATGFMPPLDTSCANHEGSGVVRFLRWDGDSWDTSHRLDGADGRRREARAAEVSRLGEPPREEEGPHAALVPSRAGLTRAR